MSRSVAGRRVCICFRRAEKIYTAGRASPARRYAHAAYIYVYEKSIYSICRKRVQRIIIYARGVRCFCGRSVGRLLGKSAHASIRKSVYCEFSWVFFLLVFLFSLYKNTRKTPGQRLLSVIISFRIWIYMFVQVRVASRLCFEPRKYMHGVAWCRLNKSNKNHTFHKVFEFIRFSGLISSLIRSMPNSRINLAKISRYIEITCILEKQSTFSGSFILQDFAQVYTSSWATPTAAKIIIKCEAYFSFYI